jgi:hypothetical protein
MHTFAWPARNAIRDFRSDGPKSLGNGAICRLDRANDDALEIVDALNRDRAEVADHHDKMGRRKKLGNGSDHNCQETGGNDPSHSWDCGKDRLSCQVGNPRFGRGKGNRAGTLHRVCIQDRQERCGERTARGDSQRRAIGLQLHARFNQLSKVARKREHERRGSQNFNSEVARRVSAEKVVALVSEHGRERLIFKAI